MVNAQDDRIVEFEETVVGEMARAEVARDELQRVRARLTRIGEEIQDRASGILADTTMLIDEVMDVVQRPIQDDTEEEPFEEDPEEDPEEKVPPDSPAENQIRGNDSFLTFVTRNSWDDTSSKAIVFCLTVWLTFEALEPTFVVPD